MINALNVVPSQDRPDTFDADADQWCADQLVFQAQLNSEIEALNALFAGNPYAFVYTFDSGTTDVDPGPGKLRLGSTTQSAATVMRIDAVSGGQSTAMNGIFDALATVTSAVKGSLRLMAKTNPSRWIIFDYTIIAGGTGYRNFTLLPRASSATSPFTNGEDLLVFFQRNGDSAIPGVLELISSASISTPVANLDYLNIFNDAYEKYFIEVVGLTPTVTAGDLRLALSNESGAIISSGYNNLATAGYATINSGGNAAQRAGDYCNLTIELKSVRNTAEVKGIDIRGFFTGNSPITVYGVSMNGSLSTINTKVNGFRLYWGNGANFARGYVKIYGLKAA